MSLRTLPPSVALVDATGRISPAELAEVAGALTEQVLKDVAPIWHTPAAVHAVPRAGIHQWAIIIKPKLDEPGALGYHTDEHNQPIAYVEYGPDWTVTCSHELLEMLIDPFGNRMHGGRLPKGLEAEYTKFGLHTPSSHVSYLLELCDPCEAVTYDIGGVKVSDFLRPSWYDAQTTKATTFIGGNGPRAVQNGGYVSFTAGGRWWQAFANGTSLEVRSLGVFRKVAYATLREFTDEAARDQRSGRRNR
jgi:hypothetical protein